MKTTKKILSVVLATIMMLSVFAIGFTVSAAGDKVIDRIDITYRSDVAGLTFRDAEYICSTSTPHVEVDLDVVDTERYYYMDKMVAGDSYIFIFVAYCDDDYIIAEDVEVYVNNEKIPKENLDNIASLKKIDTRVTAEYTSPIKVSNRSFADRISYFFDKLFEKIAGIINGFDIITIIRSIIGN